MDTALTTPDRVTIRRMRAEYLVSAQHPEPARVQARLDATVTHDLTRALAVMMAPHAGRSGICWIRRLHVDVDVNADWEPMQLARVWSRAFTDMLTDTLEGVSDGENMLWFPSRAAFLAQFLADVAGNCAWGKWQYETFEGLRHLPASAVLRTALCEDAMDGLAALRLLPPPGLRQVLRGLTQQDARRVLDKLGAEGQADSMRAWRALWAALDSDSSAFSDELHQALALFVAAARADQEAPGTALRAAALAIVRLDRLLSRLDDLRREQLLAALSGDLAELYVVAGPADAGVLTSLLHCPRDWVREVGQAVLARHVGTQPGLPGTVAEHRETAFGSIFLLLPLLAALPLAEATAGWPDMDEIPAGAVARWLIWLKCNGLARAGRSFYDPLARELLGVPHGLAAADVAVWQRRITPRLRRSFLATLAAWRRSQERTRTTPYLLARARARSGPLAVLIDGERGAWIDSVRIDKCSPGRLTAWLAGWLASDEQPALLCERRLLDALSSDALPGPVIPLEEAAPDTTGFTAELLARLPRLAEDLAYLSLPPALGIQPALDVALSVAAQGVLRRFAWKLPGFAFSSLPYLAANFLDIAASLEDAPDRLVVHLARPHLHLVLSMTGAARASYSLPWRDDRPLTLWME